MSDCEECRGCSRPLRSCWRCGGTGLVSDGVAQRPAIRGCGCSACSLARPAPHRRDVEQELDRPVRDVVLGVLVAALVLVFLVWGLAVIPA